MNSQPSINIDIATATATGLNILDTFIKTSTPVIKNISEKLGEFERNITNDLNGNANDNANGNANDNANANGNANDNANGNATYLNKNKCVKSLEYKQHETDNSLFIAVNIPRISKEQCIINFKDYKLIITAQTDEPEFGFEFLVKEFYRLNILLPKTVMKNNIIANYKNGMLYITINKQVINEERIDINSL